MPRLSAVAVCAVAAVLAGCATPAYAQPPVRYQGNVTFVVRYVDIDDISRVCAPLTGEFGNHGCVKDGVQYKANRCQWSVIESYRDLDCHELGHLNNWAADHPGL